MIKKGLDEWRDLLTRYKLKSAEGENCIVARADSRKLLPNFPENSISCAITSPPYGELKDYGSKQQIGFGQDVQTEYLPDLHQVFSQLFRIVKQGGSLWVVLDMLRHAGETMVLPWEVITIAKSQGWTFHDLVVWDKGKSLPWPNPGRFRGVCEYILLFGKGKLTTFNLNEARDSEHLSPYWVKYPERYHPDGKAPSDLWHFPIPNQGTWSGSKLKHQCPFPVALVERMVLISTRKGEIVLDPFSGTGSVPAIAGHLGRLGLGIEINRQIVTELAKNRFSDLRNWIEAELPLDGSRQNRLRKFVIELRMQKFAKSLYASLVRGDELGKEAEKQIALFIISSAKRTQLKKTADLESDNLGRMKLNVLVTSEANIEYIQELVTKTCKKQPLSLFGLKVDTQIIGENTWRKATFSKKFTSSTWFVYRKGRFYSFDDEIGATQLQKAIIREADHHKKGVPTIISELKVSLESPPKDSISLG